VFWKLSQDFLSGSEPFRGQAEFAIAEPLSQEYVASSNSASFDPFPIFENKNLFTLSLLLENVNFAVMFEKPVAFPGHGHVD
jgi:Leucine-rich repeat (LRR) protein